MFIFVRILNETNVTWKEDENKQNKVHARGYSIYSAYMAYMSTRFVDTDTIPPGNGFFCQKKLMLRRSQTFFNLFLKNKKKHERLNQLSHPSSLPPSSHPCGFISQFPLPLSFTSIWEVRLQQAEYRAAITPVCGDKSSSTCTWNSIDIHEHSRI